MKEIEEMDKKLAFVHQRDLPQTKEELDSLISTIVKFCDLPEKGDFYKLEIATIIMHMDTQKSTFCYKEIADRIKNQICRQLAYDLLQELKDAEKKKEVTAEIAE
jgi:hypothetical protein